MSDIPEKNAIQRFIDKNPGRVSGITVMVGDLLMTSSGIVFNNWGRFLSSIVGLLDNLPQIIAGDKFAKDQQALKNDAQDAKGWNRLKFWRYPWELSATSSLVQGIIGTFIAAPDTVSALSKIFEFEAGVSVNEAMRPLEFLSGLSCIAGSAVMYVREASDDEVAAAGRERLGGYKSLREEFSMAGRYLKKMIGPLSENGRQNNSLSEIWRSTIRDISYAGPNAVAAHPLQVGLPLLMLAGLQKGDWGMITNGIVQGDAGMALQGLSTIDWNMTGAAGAFMLSNSYLAKSTKRIKDAPAPAAS